MNTYLPSQFTALLREFMWKQKMSTREMSNLSGLKMATIRSAKNIGITRLQTGLDICWALGLCPSSFFLGKQIGWPNWQRLQFCADRLWDLRNQNRWTQADLAGRIGISNKRICQIELGNSQPTWGQFVNMCVVFEVSPHELC